LANKIACFALLAWFLRKVLMENFLATINVKLLLKNIVYLVIPSGFALVEGGKVGF
jgi:hypothetical protein